MSETEQQSNSNVEEEEMSEIFEEEEQEEEEKWETLKNHDDYEISTKFPFPIRKKSNKKILAECLNSYDYFVCSLNKKQYYKHRLIALQFIPNDDPEHKTQINHINHDRTDNHLTNLRWVSQSDNQKNKTAHINDIIYEYFDTIDEEAIEITDYGKYKFEFYYFVEKEDSFYYYNGKQYRKLHVNYQKRDDLYVVNMYDINNKFRKIYLNKFKRLYGIEF